MKRLELSNIKKNLKKFNKVLVIGPPRSGTTISTLIIAEIIKYKMIDESWYDGNDANKFMYLLHLDRKLAIQSTAFVRDVPKLSEFWDYHNIAIVIVKRKIADILDSFKNTIKFIKDDRDDRITHNMKGLFNGINEGAKGTMRKHYDPENSCSEKNVPELIYHYWDEHYHQLNQDKLFCLYYEDLAKHKLFVRKKERRSNFTHIKQVKVDDPSYLINQKGMMIL